MQARTLRVFAAILVTACSAGEVTEPPRPLGTNPLSAIQDGANSGGNLDFFFLPPMVDDPAGNPNFLNNGLNVNLIPTVTITTGTTTILDAVPATFSVDHYRLNWQVPVSTTSTTYRVTINLGTTALGFADVYAAANSADLKNADNDVVALKDGRTLPIRFTIENFALCGTTSQPTCASETINTSVGGEVVIPQGGVEIPPQPGAGQTTTITVSTCPDIPSDLPSFGSCIRVLANPPLTSAFTVPAEVWVCDAGLGALTDQEHRVTMHRYDAPNTKALPHAHDQCATVIGDAGGDATLRGAVAAVFKGQFRTAGRQLKVLLSPRPLYASAVLDVGAGGETDGFSDFQLLLPAKMTKCGGDGLTVPAGSVVAPTVCVTDLAGDPVQGATVHFATSSASVAALSIVTGTDGKATASWTIGATPGVNSLVASGNGIASSGTNGSARASFDPFQPFPYEGPPSPESGTSSGAVSVLTGSETFTATGVVESVGALFDFGSSGWSAKQQSESVAAPSDWQNLIFDPVANGFTLNNPSPFGAATASCGLTAATTWTLGTTSVGGGNDILVRKLFSTSTATAVQLRVSVDNDLVEVWLNGTKLNASTLLHEGCAAPGTIQDFVFNANTVAGTNVIAVRARDRGGVSYLNVRIAPQIP